VASGEWLEFPLKCNSFWRIDATCILGQGFEMHERRKAVPYARTERQRTASGSRIFDIAT